MRKFSAVFAICSALVLSACAGSKDGFRIPKKKDLEPGGVYVAYSIGCEQGCDALERGDLIQQVDGSPAASNRDLASLTDGQPHKLQVLSFATGAPKEVTLVAKPGDNLPPLTGTPPLWTVSAEDLNKAPDWARRRMFAHASPMVQLVSIDGGILDGRQLYGKKRFIVYWDHGSRQEQADAASIMQVLQRAQADLNNFGIEVMFVQVRFPTGRQVPMNDSDLRAFQDKFTQALDDGSKPAPLPMYRFPNATEFNAARELGLENAFTVFENLGRSPAIVLLDEDGIVRWHSEGTETPPAHDPQKAGMNPAVYTTVEAVNWALTVLGGAKIAS